MLTTGIIDSMFEALLKIEPNRLFHSDVVTLFGGEPLLKANVALVEYMVKKGKELGYRFTATTNGYDLDNYLHLLSQDMIYGVQITIDGTKDTHNLRRKHHSKKDTFNKIVTNIKLALHIGALIKVRVNVDAGNIHEIQDLLFYLRSEQILDHPNFKIYIEYIGGTGNFCPENYKDWNTEQEIESFIDAVAKLSPSVPYSLSLYSNLFNAILKGKPLALNPQHCGANSKSYILDPDGNIYACHEFVGSQEQIIGRYKPELKWISSTLDAWHQRQVLQMDNCSCCKYALLCGGGCGARSIISKNKFCCNDFQDRLIGITNILINKTTV